MHCTNAGPLRFLTDLVMRRPLSQQLSVVDSLSPRQDLLPSHEHVVGVGVFLADGEDKGDASADEQKVQVKRKEGKKKKQQQQG